MAQWQPFPSASDTGVTRAGGNDIDPFETIGHPSDPVAADIDDPNTFMSLLKGIAYELGIPAGTGSAFVGPARRRYEDLAATLGDPGDDAAENTGTQSTISLLKGLLVEAQDFV